jgi:poly-beta-1,6-N-acetyl-D-glucosamine synthase
LLAIFVNPLFLLAYLIDVPAMAIPVLYKAIQRKEVALALTSMPGFLVLRLVNGVFLLKALWRELVVNKPLMVYEKGH